MATEKPSLDNVKKDLMPLVRHAVVAYGSWCTSHFSRRSDIDIAVISMERSHPANLKLFQKLLGSAPERYDIKVFELLPLTVQISIIENHKTIFGGELEISEYFYHYRKLWKDVRGRIAENQFSSATEKLARRMSFA